jgi:hypothetical protein
MVRFVSSGSRPTCRIGAFAAVPFPPLSSLPTMRPQCPSTSMRDATKAANRTTGLPRGVPLLISLRFVIHPEQGAWELAMGLRAVGSFR